MTTVAKTVLLKNKDVAQGEGVRGASSILPGMLVKITGEKTIVPADSGSIEQIIAVEKAFDGKGIEDPYTVTGEVVEYITLIKGDVFYGLLKAGQNVTAGNLLASDSAGGLLVTSDATYAFAKAIESVNNSLGTGYKRIRVETTGNFIPSLTGVFPAITVQPADDSIASGNTSALSVTATGAATLHYEWYEGDSGDTSTPVGTDSNAFTTPALTATTNYWVRVYNTYGSVDSDTAVITVT